MCRYVFRYTKTVKWKLNIYCHIRVVYVISGNKYLKSLYSGGLLDVAAESRYVRINSRITIAGTSISPRDDTGKNVADNKWTAGVSLASIFSASGNTSAQHAVGDATRTVCGWAGRLANNLNVDSLQGGGKRAWTLGGGSPASYENGSTSGPAGARRWKAYSGYAAAQRQRRRQLQNRDVIIDDPVIVAGILVNPSDVDYLTTGTTSRSSSTDGQRTSSQSRKIIKINLHLIEVVSKYVPIGTMGSSNNVVSADYWTAADVGTVVLERDLPWDRRDGNAGASYNSAIRHQAVLAEERWDRCKNKINYIINFWLLCELIEHTWGGSYQEDYKQDWFHCEKCCRSRFILSFL